MLTDIQACKAKAADSPYKLTDGGGKHVCVTRAGGKPWRLRYLLNRAGYHHRHVPHGMARNILDRDE